MALWQSLGGTISVEITTADISSALTAIQNANIAIQDALFVDELTVHLQIQRKDWKNLRSICARRGDRIKLRGRLGVYWALKGLVKRPVLVIGCLFLFAVSIFLPTRVLFIRIEGNQTIPDNLILERAAQCGIYFGTSRKEVRSERVKNALLEAMPQLQWAGINTSGCVATISVRERAAEEESPRSSGISSIVATRDAIVQFLTVTNGSAVCKVGQAVRSGQILISGYTDSGLLIRGCRASGEVYGLTERDLTLISPTQFRMRGKMEGQSRKYAVIIGKKRINFYKGSGISDASCDKMYLENYVTLPGGFILPIAIATEVWTQYSFDDVTDPADPSAFADLFLAGMMRSGRILSRNEIITNKEGIAILDGHYQCHEMIGIQQQEEIVKPNE